MSHTFEEARRWQQEGTVVLLAALDRLRVEDYDEPAGVPGWGRKNLLAHVAANADALQNLVTWARTGMETPMYASAEARSEAIEKGSRLAADKLAAWVRQSADALETAMAALTDEQWETKVVTAQGRTVPAAATPWMRSREVFVHAVDIANGTTFADLPEDFLLALQEDIKNKRGVVPEVLGTVADVTAWLAGRPYANLTQTDGSPAPVLGPWL